MTRTFTRNGSALRGVDAAGAAELVTSATDVTLVLDAAGVIEDIAVGGENLQIEGSSAWIGRSWRDTVTMESRAKVDELLRDAVGSGPRRWRHVNYPASNSPDVPVVYTAVGLGDGRIVALGRDIRPLAELQRRVVDAQQSMEREYLRLRQAEMRYRILFHDTAEAVLIIEASTRIIVEANPAAGTLLGSKPERLVGTVFPRDFAGSDSEAIIGLFASVRSGARARDLVVKRPGDGGSLRVAASLLRHDMTSHFVVRLGQVINGAAVPQQTPEQQCVATLDRLPDGIVLTNESGRIVVANHAFLNLIQMPSDAAVRGEFLDQWVGVPGVDMPVLLANLRERGSVRLFRTTLRDVHRSVVEVEISAIAVPDDATGCYAFALRDTAQRIVAAGAKVEQLLPRPLDQLGALVGRVPLKELVREATDLVERLCIEAALDLTGNNRASAADMLGLSRQSLYMKLHRYGLCDFDPEPQN